MKILLVLVTLIKFNYAFNDRFITDKVPHHIDISNVDINMNKTCDIKGKKCIWKCCPEGQIIGRFKECIVLDKGPYKFKSTLDNITVYNEKFAVTNKSLKNDFILVPGVMKDEKFSYNSLWWYNKTYLLEDGKLFLKFPNLWNRWKKIETNHFCVDLKKNGSIISHVFMAEYELEQFRLTSTVKMSALIVSIICLTVTLVVYLIVPQLRDLNGIILMIFFSCLIMAFSLHSSLESYSTMKLWMSQIITITFIHYFFKVASFCWTNIMFYRILTMRTQSKDEPAKLITKILKYCPHGFGFPLFMTILVATIELANMTDMPSFITPQIQNRGNFTFQEMESLFYLYIPLMMILAFNWIVCFIKVVEFYKTSQRSAVISSYERKDEDINLHRPMQFVKLLAVMSVYALVEMLTVIHPIGTRYLSSTFTFCVGPIIMIILISSQAVRGLLMKQIMTYKVKSRSYSFDMTTFFQKN